MTKRLFIGSMLLTPQCKLLNELKAELDPQFSKHWNGCNLRWVKPEKLHITWLFLGDCEEKEEQSAIADLRDSLVGESKLEIQYDLPEVFGSRSRPTALVLVPHEIDARVRELALRIRARLGNYCQKKEDAHEFRPHITLFRFPYDYRTHVTVPEQISLSKYLPIKQEISKISLIESHMGGRNDGYKELANFLLQ